ncbi:hypothetical protein KC318_g462 [Hortaea werneckii]|nr:hypothetical protein KC334_g434 [Hortaea werneckii]KAI7027284.1 hypothetical protein KC355_g392 [Hortaea werneckii]KAI7676130.1 hypothetical protein KC318_g462 [Hortaea werneckii]
MLFPTSAFAAATLSLALQVGARQPLEYAPLPANVYTPPIRNSTVTLLDLITSRPELSTLGEIIQMPAGFAQAFATEPTWDFTFFAPSNTAFENVGTYWETYAATAKGNWWLGNQLKYHYVPNTKLQKSDFNSTLSRTQTSTYLWISTQIKQEELVLNEVATVIEADIPVTGGIVHIIDRVLDPSAQIFNEDLPRQDQEFIPGSCSNDALPYC